MRTTASDGRLRRVEKGMLNRRSFFTAAEFAHWPVMTADTSLSNNSVSAVLADTMAGAHAYPSNGIATAVLANGNTGVLNLGKHLLNAGFPVQG